MHLEKSGGINFLEIGCGHVAGNSIGEMETAVNVKNTVKRGVATSYLSRTNPVQGMLLQIVKCNGGARSASARGEVPLTGLGCRESAANRFRHGQGEQGGRGLGLNPRW